MTYIFEVAIVNKLHDEQHIDQKLSFRVGHDLGSSVVCAVQFLFHSAACL